MTFNLIVQVKHKLKLIHHLMAELGFNPVKTYYSILGLPTYISHLTRFSLNSKNHFQVKVFPCLADRYDNAGSFPLHYFHQDLWAAKKVFENNPNHHIDVGSRIDGFVAHLLSFRQVEVLDVRKLDSNISGMTFRQADLMKTKSVPEEICDSVSCLHALEHFGLGRYGDPIHPEGHIEGLNSLTRLLKPGGSLLLAVPIGTERVEFNAHRIFAIKTILDLTANEYHLCSFSYIDDTNFFHENVMPNDVPSLNYGCGLFEFRKLDYSSAS